MVAGASDELIESLLPEARDLNNRLCNSPAFAVIAGAAGHGRIPLRCETAASFPKKKIFIYLSNNPVNLSIFIEFFRNSLIPRTRREGHWAREAQRLGLLEERGMSIFR